MAIVVIHIFPLSHFFLNKRKFITKITAIRWTFGLQFLEFFLSELTENNFLKHCVYFELKFKNVKFNFIGNSHWKLCVFSSSLQSVNTHRPCVCVCVCLCDHWGVKLVLSFIFIFSSSRICLLIGFFSSIISLSQKSNICFSRRFFSSKFSQHFFLSEEFHF